MARAVRAGAAGFRLIGSDASVVDEARRAARRVFEGSARYWS